VPCAHAACIGGVAGRVAALRQAGRPRRCVAVCLCFVASFFFCIGTSRPDKADKQSLAASRVPVVSAVGRLVGAAPDVTRRSPIEGSRRLMQEGASTLTRSLWATLLLLQPCWVACPFGWAAAAGCRGGMHIGRCWTAWTNPRCGLQVWHQSRAPSACVCDEGADTRHSLAATPRG